MALQFKLPQMSLTMQEGTIIKWIAEEGDCLKRNDALLEIETDKTTAELTAPCDGILIKKMFPDQSVVGVGEVICVIDDGTETQAPTERKKPEKKQVPSAPVVSEPGGGKRGKPVSPLAAKIAEKAGLSLDGITGTGPRNIIVKRDVEAAIEQTRLAAARAPEGDDVFGLFQDIPFTGVRKKTAENMMLSCMNTAAVTTFVEADMGTVKRMREFVKATYTAYVVKAASKALQRFPGINSALMGNQIRFYENTNINVAVSADDKLVTPVVRKVNERSILDVNDEIAVLADKAREGTLSLHDFEGGTFTVTNSGVFGSLFFTPIINYPQCAILGMGKTVETPVVRDGQIVIAPVMKLCLTYDHRLVDGATAVKFLVQVKEYLENPSELIR